MYCSFHHLLPTEHSRQFRISYFIWLIRRNLSVHSFNICFINVKAGEGNAWKIPTSVPGHVVVVRNLWFLEGFWKVSVIIDYPSAHLLSILSNVANW